MFYPTFGISDIERIGIISNYMKITMSDPISKRDQEVAITTGRIKNISSCRVAIII